MNNEHARQFHYISTNKSGNTYICFNCFYMLYFVVLMKTVELDLLVISVVNIQWQKFVIIAIWQ